MRLKLKSDVFFAVGTGFRPVDLVCKATEARIGLSEDEAAVAMLLMEGTPAGDTLLRLIHKHGVSWDLPELKRYLERLEQASLLQQEARAAAPAANVPKTFEVKDTDVEEPHLEMDEEESVPDTDVVDVGPFFEPGDKATESKANDDVAIEDGEGREVEEMEGESTAANPVLGRFRADLRQRQLADNTIEVLVPNTGEKRRFTLDTIRLAELFDGHRRADEIVAAAQLEGLPASRDIVYRLARKLKQHHMLASRLMVTGPIQKVESWQDTISDDDRHVLPALPSEAFAPTVIHRPPRPSEPAPEPEPDAGSGDDGLPTGSGDDSLPTPAPVLRVREPVEFTTPLPAAPSAVKASGPPPPGMPLSAPPTLKGAGAVPPPAKPLSAPPTLKTGEAARPAMPLSAPPTLRARAAPPPGAPLLAPPTLKARAAPPPSMPALSAPQTLEASGASPPTGMPAVSARQTVEAGGSPEPAGVATGTEKLGESLATALILLRDRKYDEARNVLDVVRQHSPDNLQAKTLLQLIEAEELRTKQVGRRRRALLVGALAALLLCGVGILFIPVTGRVELPCQAERISVGAVSSTIKGKIEQLKIEDGALLHEGQLVAVIINEDLVFAQKLAEEKLANLVDLKRLMKDGGNEKEEQKQRGVIKKLKEELLIECGSRAFRCKAQQAANREALRIAKKKLRHCEWEAYPEEVAKVEATMRETRARIDKLQRTARQQLRSTKTGRVSELRKSGEVWPGDVIAKLHDARAFSVKFTHPTLQAGQTVEVTLGRISAFQTFLGKATARDEGTVLVDVAADVSKVDFTSACKVKLRERKTLLKKLLQLYMDAL